MKDHGLRLFGKHIQLITKDIELDLRVDQGVRDYNNSDDDDHNYCDHECSSPSVNSKQSENRGFHEKISSQEPKEMDQPQSQKGSHSTIAADDKPVTNNKECSSPDSHNKNSSDQTSSTTNLQDQTSLKKPDKILPCPRCNSMTTKFCYFNNYNVNQPRHFCKDCQRYWTAGGTMRNVPVGSGKRKSKNSSVSLHRHLMVPEGYSQLRSSSYNSFFVETGRNGLSGFPVSFCSTGNQNWESCTTFNSPSSVSSRKHSRDGTVLIFGMDVMGEKKSEHRRVVIPKTSKAGNDDPIEASNSSIWNTLQIKNNHHVSPPIAKVGFFGGVQKFDANRFSERRNPPPSGEESSMFLGLNPAAFSRSPPFHETPR